MPRVPIPISDSFISAPVTLIIAFCKNGDTRFPISNFPMTIIQLVVRVRFIRLNSNVPLIVILLNTGGFSSKII